MTSYTGIDGTVHLTEGGVTFERTKFRASGRGVPPVHAVPWSAVAGATVDKAALRVQVAGYDAPRINTGDPHAVAFKRGQSGMAGAFAVQINQRCAGPDALPSFQPATAPVVTPSIPAGLAPQPVGHPTSRLYKLMEAALWLQLILLLIPIVLVIVVVVVLLLA